MAVFPRTYVAADNAGSRTIVIVALISPVLATVTVAARFYARKLQRLGFAVDDWLILSALLPVWGHTAIILSSVYLGGIGHHGTRLDANNFTVLFQTLPGLQFAFGISLGLIKSSIILLLMRIFFTKRFKTFAMPVLAYCICWTFMTILIAACVCRPFALNWNSKLKGHCGDRNAAYIAISALDIIGDALICVLPMPMIWRLRTSTSTKFGLSAVFTLGFLNIIVAILRIIYLVKLHNTSDYTWDAVKCWIWSVLEPGLAVLVACAPTLQPVIAVAMGRRIFPKAAHLDNHTSYPSYPERHQQFSNISDTDYPLRPVYGNISHANSNSGKPSRINSTSSRRGDGNYETRQKDSDVIDYQQTGIRVQKDITVKRALIG